MPNGVTVLGCGLFPDTITEGETSTVQLEFDSGTDWTLVVLYLGGEIAAVEVYNSTSAMNVSFDVEPGPPGDYPVDIFISTLDQLTCSQIRWGISTLDSIPDDTISQLQDGEPHTLTDVSLAINNGDIQSDAAAQFAIVSVNQCLASGSETPPSPNV